jgi:hypothetical protein
MSEKKKSRGGSTRSGGGDDDGNDPAWKDMGRSFWSELWSCFLIGTLAAGSNVLTRQFTGHSLDPLSYGLAFGLMYVATAFPFHHAAWFVSPNVLIASWWSMKADDMSWGMQSHYFCILVAQFGGWTLAALAFWGLTAGNLDNAAALSNVHDFGTIFFYEVVGQTLMCQIYLMASACVDKSFRFIGMAALETVLVGVFFNVTGGSGNFARTFAYQIILGTWDWTVAGAVLLATFVAPFLAVLFQNYIYREKCRTHLVPAELSSILGGKE